MLAIAFVELVKDRTAVTIVGQFFLGAALMGAMAGVVLGPVAAWTLMRRVPIWKAIAGTAAGSTIGFVAGYLLGWFYERQPLWSLAGTLLGFIAASILLRLTSSSRVEAILEGGR